MLALCIDNCDAQLLEIAPIPSPFIQLACLKAVSATSQPLTVSSLSIALVVLERARVLSLQDFSKMTPTHPTQLLTKATDDTLAGGCYETTRVGVLYVIAHLHVKRSARPRVGGFPHTVMEACTSPSRFVFLKAEVAAEGRLPPDASF